jgi:hypothetical protein
MGGPDAAPALGVMGRGDSGTLTHLFRHADSSFVDWLFTARRR